MAYTARTMPGTGRTTTSKRTSSFSMSTSTDEDWPLCGAVSRGGKKVPHAVPFPTARRELGKPGGAGADVPFYFNPPSMTVREHTTEIRNAAQVPFATATREQWVRVNVPVTSSEAAGPGAYDVIRGIESLSTKHKTIKVGAFFTAPREERALLPATAAGPGEYEVAASLDTLNRRAPALSFTRATRVDRTGVPASATVPLRLTQGIDKHRPEPRFSTARGHDNEAMLPATASVPLYSADRPKKHKPAFRFTTAPRFT